MCSCALSSIGADVAAAAADLLLHKGDSVSCRALIYSITLTRVTSDLMLSVNLSRICLFLSREVLAACNISY